MFGLQEGRDKQFLVKQIKALTKHLQIPTHREEAEE